MWNDKRYKPSKFFKHWLTLNPDTTDIFSEKILLKNSKNISGIYPGYIFEGTTSTSASAVTWLTKEQTSGKKQPYMYTQNESIHARSIAPLQDTPAVKSTYKLDIKTPTDIIVRGSGNVTHEFIDEEFRHTTIEMNIPIQSYLLAIAAGNLLEKQVGERTYSI